MNKNNAAFEYDQVNIICPVYQPGVYDSEAEKYIIYNVSTLINYNYLLHSYYFLVNYDWTMKSACCSGQYSGYANINRYFFHHLKVVSLFLSPGIDRKITYAVLDESFVRASFSTKLNGALTLSFQRQD